MKRLMLSILACLTVASPAMASPAQAIRVFTGTGMVYVDPQKHPFLYRYIKGQAGARFTSDFLSSFKDASCNSTKRIVASLPSEVTDGAEWLGPFAVAVQCSSQKELAVAEEQFQLSVVTAAGKTFDSGER